MTPRFRPSIRTAALLAAAIAFASPASRASDLCGEDGEWSQMHFDEGRGQTRTDLQPIHEAAPRGVWKIDCGENGSVQLSAWDKDEVLICAQITAWTRDKKGHPESLLRSIHVETAGGLLRAEGPAQSKAARWAVSYKIFAPRRIDLDVQTENGGISLEGIHGRMNLRSVNGPIAIEDAGGDVRGRTSNGPVSATLSGSRWKGEGLDLETSNGPVHLSIPEGFSAELETGTENGPMESAIPVAARGRQSRRIVTVLGSGGPPVRVVTTNGPVVVTRP